MQHLLHGGAGSCRVNLHASQAFDDIVSRLCSDLLGQISMISGYYTQENSSLLFNNLSEVIHQRCDGLKINIQLKILHALLPADA